MPDGWSIHIAWVDLRQDFAILGLSAPHGQPAFHEADNKRRQVDAIIGLDASGSAKNIKNAQRFKLSAEMLREELSVHRASPYQRWSAPNCHRANMVVGARSDSCLE